MSSTMKQDLAALRELRDQLDARINELSGLNPRQHVDLDHPSQMRRDTAAGVAWFLHRMMVRHVAPYL